MARLRSTAATISFGFPELNGSADRSGTIACS
jgi:hypothetical protein